MEAAYISTKGLNDANRLSVLRLQNRLLVAQKEVATGRLADAGKTLGARTSETVSLRQQYDRFTVLAETNSIAETRLSVSQSAISDMVKIGQDFVNAVLLARDAEGGAGVSRQQAQASLTALVDGLNTSVGGEFIFAGINTSVKPVATYDTTPSSPAQSSVAAAFLADFGTTQSDPANENITPAAMQTFLDTTFAGLFDPAGWSADWSTASDQNIVSRIGQSEDVQSSANANEAAFRKLAQAFTMIADLGVENLNRATFQTVAETATRLASEAINELTVIQGGLGNSEARIAATNEKLLAQRNILNTQIDNLETVDPFEASTRVTTLLTQLETAYALTARVQRLSILNYI
ncbi:MAG: flagellar hook-associated family protein [Rhodomicrobiaceae bacterium]